ncbi:uncharacterized protein APUU_20508A [Aspergillus puulaauensis]|uniref:Uncharacterized protein n=1 Tax=Aspergillus puulaauensis TaxID=1220207 RepID=A0A7R7XF53_9EURO|nr:uncharacterized protein APUU_20508A [Aspergillus puulaauensis]BCS20076.1 hypothetical protein APUU_20508A [Aspergillus puulaauensis]
MPYMNSTLHYHEQLRTLGEALAETLDVSSDEEYSSAREDQDEDMTQFYHDMIREIGNQLNKARKIEQAKEAMSKPAHGDFDVYLGVPKTPYHDNDCDCEVILHERGGEELCRSFYTVGVDVGETGEKNVYRKQQRPAFVLDGEDHHQKCNKMTEKLWVGFMRADASETFVCVYKIIEAKEPRAFACKLLVRCAKEGILPVTVGARAINRVLELLDELAEIKSADSSRTFSSAISVADA